MRAFQVSNTEGLLAGTSTLDIQLHANAGPFYLKNTLEVISRSPVLQHIQNVVYNAGELSLTFPGPHRLSNGNKVKVVIPGKAKSNTVSVPVVIISPLQLKVRYTDPAHTGPFAGYTFSAKKKVVCYTTVHKMNMNDMSMSDPIPNFLFQQGHQTYLQSLSARVRGILCVTKQFG